MKIEKEYIFPFPVAEVYRVWTSSDTVIAPAKRMHVEPAVGGLNQLFMSGDGETPDNEGRFLEVVPEVRLRYSWEWHKDGEVSEIAVSFEPVEGGTRVRLVHDGFTKPGSVAMHDAGWDSYFQGLGAFMSRGAGAG